MHFYSETKPHTRRSYFPVICPPCPFLRYAKRLCSIPASTTDVQYNKAHTTLDPRRRYPRKQDRREMVGLVGLLLVRSTANRHRDANLVNLHPNLGVLRIHQSDGPYFLLSPRLLRQLYSYFRSKVPATCIVYRNQMACSWTFATSQSRQISGCSCNYSTIRNIRSLLIPVCSLAKRTTLALVRPA